MKKFIELLTIFALFVWGGVFVWFYVSGRIEQHLDPSFRIWALLAGIGFTVLALFTLLTRNQASGCCQHDHAHGDACDHDHEHEHDHNHEDHAEHHDHHHHHHDHDDAHAHSHDEETASSLSFALLILLVPLVMAAAYSEDRFSMGYLTKWDKIERKMQQMRLAEKRAARAEQKGSEVPNPYTADAVRPGSDQSATGEGTQSPTSADSPPETNSDGTDGNSAADSNDSAEEEDEWGEFTMDDLKKMVPQSSAGDFLLDVPQIFYTAGDQELMEVMEGISIETTAQVMEETENNAEGNRLRAFRLFIECCAADARPLSIPVEFGEGLPDYQEMGWYKLIGNLNFSREDGEFVPLLKIKTIEETVEPVDGMMY